MRPAVIRGFVCAALLLGGVLSAAAMAGTTDPIGTVTSAVSTVLSQTTVASNLTGTVTSATSDASGSESSGSVSGASGSLSGATSDLTGSGASSSSSSSDGGTSSSDGGSSASGGSGSGGAASASSPGTPRTRFDRLPRRYEILLERIEFGHHVRANLARLRALIASASPDFRARLSRLIRHEIRRLERGGLTRRERAAVRRLRSLLLVVASRPAASTAATATTSFRSARLARGGVLSATATGTLSGSVALAARGTPPKERGIAAPNLPRLLIPEPPSGRDWWAIAAVALVVLGAFFALKLLLAGRRHDPLHPMRGTIAAARPDILAFGLALLLGLTVGAAVALLFSLAH